MSSYLVNLWNERPILLNNPVILREMLPRLRRKSTFIQFFSFIALNLFFCLIWWNQLRTQDGAMVLAGSSMLGYLSTLLHLFVLIWTPLVTSVCINQELENGTWEMLRASPANLASILLAKLLAPILTMWIFIASLIPLLALSVPAGGVSGVELAIHCLALMETMFFYAAIGMYFSVREKSSIRAVSQTYGFIILTTWIIPILSQFILRSPVLILLMPSALVSIYQSPQLANMLLPSWAAGIIIPFHVAVYFLVVAITFIMTISRLRHQEIRLGEQREAPKWQRWLPSFARPQRPLYDPIPDSVHPMLALEYRNKMTQGRFSLTASLLILALLSFGLGAGITRDRFGYGAFSLITLAFIPFMVIPGATFALRREKDLGMWESLMTTTLSRFSIVASKSAMELFVFVLQIAAFLALWIIFAWTGAFETAGIQAFMSRKAFLYLPVSALATGFFLHCASLYSSARFQKMNTAYAASFVFAFLLYIGVYLLASTLGVRFGAIDVNSPQKQLLAVISPFWLYLTPAMLYNASAADQEVIWYSLASLQAVWMTILGIILFAFTVKRIEHDESESARRF
ncbi:MAG: hypothetical protein GC154_00830 [bacterium]|nr:hypothetical protein [bacterium]